MHWRIDEPQSSGPSLKSSRLPLGKDVYDPQGLPSKGHFTENWPSFGFAGYFRGKLAPFLGLSGILSGGAPPSNIQHDTPPSTNGWADNSNYQIFSHEPDDENNNFKTVKNCITIITCLSFKIIS